MVKEMSCVAKSKNKVAKYVFIGLFGTALIVACAASLVQKYSGLVWTAAFAFAVSAIYVYNRYVGAEYVYSVTDDGRPSFTVTQTVGKTSKTLARLDLYNITDVRMLSGVDLKKYKPEKGVIKYGYYPTMRPDSLLLISVRSSDENADVLIEADGEFASAISSYDSGFEIDGE